MTETIITAGLAAAIAGVVTFLTTKIQHKGKPENALIDQLQEQVGQAFERITNLETEQQKSKRRERVRDDYISKLRRHIDEGLPPPPPPWPIELNTLD